MINLDLSYPHQRALGDLLQAERVLRQKNEDLLREMRQALLEIAIRLDGERFEALRRGDPAVPSNWTAADWRKFFGQITLPSKGWGNGSHLEAEKARRELQQQVDSLKGKLAQVESELEAERSKPSIIITSPKALPAAAMPAGQVTTELLPGATPALCTLISDVKKAMQDFPKNPPAAFSKVLSGGGRTGGDLARAYQRYWIILYLIGHWRLSASMELEEILAAAVGVSSGSGSLRRVVEDLNNSNLLISETIRLDTPRTALKLHRLSPDGERLYQSVFSERPFENEWARLLRLHEGARFPDHTVAVIAFAMHARKRGWAAQILPEVKDSKAVPDAWVARGNQKLYVEVELSEKERVSKWRNQAALNAGRTALCAATTKSRERLVGDCKLDKLSGVASDLETLVKAKFKEITEGTPLWVESW